MSALEHRFNEIGAASEGCPVATATSQPWTKVSFAKPHTASWPATSPQGARTESFRLVKADQALFAAAASVK